MSVPVRKFYKNVETSRDDAGWTLLLDGRAVKTPLKKPFLIPCESLVDDIVSEWRSQGESIQPETMPYTQFLFTTLDHIQPNPAVFIDQCKLFIDTDTILFFDPDTPDLLVRQNTEWLPTLLWVERHIGIAPLKQNHITGVGAQPPEIHQFFEDLWSSYDAYAMFTAQYLMGLTGSPFLTLGLMEGYLSPEKTFERAFLEELYQSEQWGEDPQASRILQEKKADIETVHRFFVLTRNDYTRINPDVEGLSAP